MISPSMLHMISCDALAYFGLLNTTSLSNLPQESCWGHVPRT